MNTNHRFNESKFAIFTVLEHQIDYLSPRDIALRSGLSLSCVKSELTRLTRMHYIWRSKNRGAGRNWYVYRALKQKGHRMLETWRNLKTQGKSLNTHPGSKKNKRSKKTNRR